MAATWIYAFRDSRYERGIKVGYDKEPRASKAWEAAISYSPAPMLYLASWRVPLPFICAHEIEHQAPRRLEQHLHKLCGPMLMEQPEFSRTGRDWVDITADEAIEKITTDLRHAPDVVSGRGVTVDLRNDDLRFPAPTLRGNYKIDLRSYPKKVAVWIYEEHQTGRLKTQYVHDWSSPRLRRRRYSRNGFSEVAALTYHQQPSGDCNWQLYEAWCTIMCEFGPGHDDEHHGWLSPGAEFAQVLARYRSLGLTALDIGSKEAPLGIRPAHNRRLS